MNRVVRHLALALLCFSLVAFVGACSKSHNEAGTTSQTETHAVQVSHVDLGRGVDAQKRVTDSTEEFHPNETIYASVVTNGSAPNTQLTARWTFQDGQVVNESTQTISPTAEEASEFHVSKPDGWPAGKYKLEVMVNGTPAAT